METLLRKYLWAVDGLIVVLCAVFLARASATVIGGKMLVSGGAPKPVTRVATAPTAAPVYGKQVEEILRRNIFVPPARPSCKPRADRSSLTPRRPCSARR